MAELIVPVRDRRQRKRILTLKNFGRFAIALAVVFAGLTIQSEMRRGPGDGNYGRLFGKQVARQNEIAKPKFDVIKEAPQVPDQTAADPLLIQPAARAQQYGIGLEPIKPPSEVPVVTAEAPAPQPIGKGVTIVGGTNGVTIVKSDSGQHPPVLSGGIFKEKQ